MVILGPFGYRETTYGISCWKSIADTNSLVSSNTTLNIHYGKQIFFLFDCWIGNDSLAHSFSSLFKLVKDKFARLVDMISDSGSWKFDFKHLLKDAGVNRLADLLVLIGSSSPSLDNTLDTRRWFDN